MTPTELLPRVVSPWLPQAVEYAPAFEESPEIADPADVTAKILVPPLSTPLVTVPPVYISTKSPDTAVSLISRGTWAVPVPLLVTSRAPDELFELLVFCAVR